MGISGNHSALIGGWRLRALILTIALSALGYLGFSLWGGWRQVAAAVAQVGVAGLTVALLLSALNYGLRFLRWHRYLRLLGQPVPFKDNLIIYIAGFGLTILPGKGGEAVRSLFLKNHGVPYPVSLAAFFSERLSDLVSVLLIAGFGLWQYPPAKPYALALGAMLVAALIILHHGYWLRAIHRRFSSRLPPKLERATEAAIDIICHAAECFRPPTLALGVLLGTMAWGAEGVAFHYIVQLLGGDLPLQTAMFIYAFAILVGAVSFLPGGLGGTEAAMTALLVLNHLGQPEAVAATVLIRIATLWFAVALGLAALGRLTRAAPPR